MTEQEYKKIFEDNLKKYPEIAETYRQHVLSCLEICVEYDLSYLERMKLLHSNDEDSAKIYKLDIDELQEIKTLSANEVFVNEFNKYKRLVCHAPLTDEDYYIVGLHPNSGLISRSEYDEELDKIRKQSNMVLYKEAKTTFDKNRTNFQEVVSKGKKVAEKHIKESENFINALKDEKKFLEISYSMLREIEKKEKAALRSLAAQSVHNAFAHCGARVWLPEEIVKVVNVNPRVVKQVANRFIEYPTENMLKLMDYSHYQAYYDDPDKGIIYMPHYVKDDGSIIKIKNRNRIIFGGQAAAVEIAAGGLAEISALILGGLGIIPLAATLTLNVAGLASFIHGQFDNSKYNHKQTTLYNNFVERDKLVENCMHDFVNAVEFEEVFNQDLSKSKGA